MNLLDSPFIIPVLGIVFGTVMVAAIVAMALWYKGRERELQVHQEMQMRQLEHDRRMKELELEIEKTRVRGT